MIRSQGEIKIIRKRIREAAISSLLGLEIPDMYVKIRVFYISCETR